LRSAYEPRHDRAAVGQAEQLRRFGAEPSDRFADREEALLADPVGEQERRLARIHDEADVSAGVGQAHDGVGVAEHGGDGVEIVVEERPVEQRRPVAFGA